MSGTEGCVRGSVPELRRRLEKKFIISIDDYHRLVEALGSFSRPDAHGDLGGIYRVTSLYFDNPEHEAYWDRVDSKPWRRKLRVRAYGPPEGGGFTRVMVEIKRREGIYVTKSRLVLPLEQAMALCRGESVPEGLSPENLVVAESVLALVRTWHLKPVCLVSYRRQAFSVANHASHMRVTFDFDVRGRVTGLELGSAGRNRRILPPGRILMEVKTRLGWPGWWTVLLRQIGSGPGPFSKYNSALRGGLIRLKSLWAYQEDLYG
jgi:hypothetical protein